MFDDRGSSALLQVIGRTWCQSGDAWRSTVNAGSRLNGTTVWSEQARGNPRCGAHGGIGISLEEKCLQSIGEVVAGQSASLVHLGWADPDFTSWKCDMQKMTYDMFHWTFHTGIHRHPHKLGNKNVKNETPEFTQDEVQTAIDGLKKGKASDSNGI